MKYLITSILLLIASFVSAQIVNIPDPVFKAFLLNDASINTNGNGEIELSEALTITDLNLNAIGAVSNLTGIRDFANLQTLNVLYNSQLTSLDVSGLVNLTYIYCYSNSINQLNFTGCTNLLTLSCERNQLTGAIDLTGLPALKQVNFDNNSLTSVKLDGLHHIFDFSCRNSLLPMTEISARNCDSLYSFAVFAPTIETIDISGSTKMSALTLDCMVRNVIARNCTSFTGFLSTASGDGNLTLLDLSGCSNLRRIDIDQDYNFTVLDLSFCPYLTNVNLTCSFGDPGIKNLNVKNGSRTRLSLNASPAGGTNIPNICVDDFETDSLFYGALPSYFNNVNNVYISSTCSFFPGGTYNTLKGKVRFDLNNNGCDNTDAGINLVPIKITDDTGAVVVRYSYINGDYAHYPYAGNFIVQPYFPYAWFTISPAAANIDFATASSLVDSANFCVSPNGVHNDVNITLLPTGFVRPGFPATYTLTYKNRGTTVQSGSVQLNYDNSKLNFNSAMPAAVNQSTGQLTWNYSNLQPFETRNISLIFSILPPPINNAGDTIIYLASVTPLVNDETPGNNSFTLPQGIRGSFDPNSKECLQGDQIAISSVDKPLDYIIHFQNLGNDTAFNVAVTDTLSNNLDWESFDFTGSSHRCDVQRKGNKLQFYFRDIHLPYATINEPASHGYIAFKIKPNSNVIIGDSLKNKASIYFDFNLPVVTNIATTIVSPTSTVPVKLEYFSLVNKNEANQLIWKASSTTGITDFAIERSNDGIHFTNIGNITATMERCQSPFNFTDEKPFDGKNYYRINIKDANGISFYSRVLVAERIRSGLSIITAVVSNQNNTTLYLNASKEQTVQMKIIAADGRLVYNQTKTILAGSSTMNLSIKSLSTGIYTLVVYTNDGEVVTKRFIK